MAHKPPEQESVSIFDSSFILLPDRREQLPDVGLMEGSRFEVTCDVLF